MKGEENEAQLQKRLDELAQRVGYTGIAQVTGFLSPAEAQWARQAAARHCVNVALEGGYEDAERSVACFYEEELPPLPICALELTWRFQSAPGHRDVLGSVMALGLKRSCIGDIVLENDKGWLFVLSQMCDTIATQLVSAGKARLQIRRLEALPTLEAPKGEEGRDTIASSRLDAVVASGFHLSRSDAADLIRAGLVKLRHLPQEHTDAHVEEGDTISVRGYGRIVIITIGSPTKKGRLPLIYERFGTKK